MILGSALQNRVAIVTGASSGIGKAIAMALARSGVKVAMAARRVERLQEVQKVITEAGGVAITVKTDVSNREEVFKLYIFVHFFFVLQHTKSITLLHVPVYIQLKLHVHQI